MNTATTPETPSAPAPKGPSATATFFVAALGLFLSAFMVLLSGSMTLSILEGKPLWAAAAGGIGIGFVVPLVVGIMFSKGLMSVLRIFAGLNLVAILAGVVFFPTPGKSALNAYGNWPSVMMADVPQSHDNDVSGRLARAIARALPGENVDLVSDAFGGGVAALPAGSELTPAAVFQKAKPSVVVVETLQQAATGPLAKLAERFGLDAIRGHGSGFVVEADGLIATNYHVIRNAHAARVRFADGRSFDNVTVIAEMPENDLALIKIPVTDLPVLPLAEKSPEVGETANALGAPLGLDYTFTTGIVSAKREMTGTNMLQVQTTIAPGSSGGPLLNARAELIGVNTATRGAGLNLAVEVEYVKALLARARNARPLKAWTEGVSLVSFAVDRGALLPTDRAGAQSMMEMVATSMRRCNIITAEKDASVTIHVPGGERVALRVDDGTKACVEKADGLSGLVLQMSMKEASKSPMKLRAVFNGVTKSKDTPFTVIVSTEPPPPEYKKRRRSNKADAAFAAEIIGAIIGAAIPDDKGADGDGADGATK